MFGIIFTLQYPKNLNTISMQLKTITERFGDSPPYSRLLTARQKNKMNTPNLRVRLNYQRREEVARSGYKSGAPGEIRTPDQLVRSQLLYPAELRARGEKYIRLN